MDKLKLSAGVVVDVATDVVNNGLRLPELKLLTEPLEGVDHAGSPDTTVNTCPVVPMANLAAAGVAFS